MSNDHLRITRDAAVFTAENWSRHYYDFAGHNLWSSGIWDQIGLSTSPTCPFIWLYHKFRELEPVLGNYEGLGRFDLATSSFINLRSPV